MNSERQDRGGRAQVLAHSCQRAEAKLNEPAPLGWNITTGVTAPIWLEWPTVCFTARPFVLVCVCGGVHCAENPLYCTVRFAFRNSTCLLWKKAFAAWNPWLNISGVETGPLSVSILNSLSDILMRALLWRQQSFCQIRLLPFSKRWISHFNLDLNSLKGLHKLLAN